MENSGAQAVGKLVIYHQPQAGLASCIPHSVKPWMVQLWECGELEEPQPQSREGHCTSVILWGPP